jgi:flagellar protein FlgJ
MSIQKIPGSPIPFQKPQVTAEQADAQLRDASKMYEKYFLNEMVKAMRKTVTPAEMTTPSFAEKIYSEQMDNNYVEKWGDQGGVGLANIIYDQLQDRFFNRGPAPKPNGPLPIDKGTRIKIDESRQYGIPVAHPRTEHGQDVSFLYEWDKNKMASRDVTAPLKSQVVQMYSNDQRQTIKLKHDDGLLSTISFLGQTKDLQLGDQLDSGEVLGALAPDAAGLTWQVGRIASPRQELDV